MKNAKRVFKRLVFIASITLLAILAGTAAVSADYFPGPVAAVTTSAGRLDFEPNNAAAAMTLTVSGANGAYYSASYGPGEAPSFALVDNAGNSFPDGPANYELQVNLPANARGSVKTVPERGASQSGGFAVVEGAILYSAGGGGPIGDLDPGGPVLEDYVINDDLIVDGSACIGFDCVNGESFGFDTIRLKENNLRIKFDDTSVAASYPRNDWQLTANDSANGGASKFSIDDITGGRTPFTVEAGAPSHSLYVDDGGRVGLGTSVPSVEIHAIDGDTPTLRLQQDGSSGFAPQTWDVAGNETNFFVRDVTNGSQLPFRIRPEAPTNSIHIAADGDVGVGTASPEASLHVLSGGTSAVSSDRAAIFTNNGDTTDHVLVTLESGTSGQSTIYFGDAAGETQGYIKYHNDGDYFSMRTGGGTEAVRIDSSGNMGLGTDTPGGRLDVDGAIFQRGASLHADYVFEEGYALESIEEHAEFMWKNRHLKGVPKARYDENGAELVEIGSQRKGILEELEKAHIYIDRLNGKLEELEKAQIIIGRLAGENERLGERLERLEALLTEKQ